MTSTKKLAFTGICLALGIIMSYVVVPIPNTTGSISLAHIPIIIGASVGGPLVGTFLGGIFGVVNFQIYPAFGLGAIIPKLLMGFVSGLVFKLLKKKNLVLRSSVSLVIGTLTNTLSFILVAYVIGAIPELIPYSTVKFMMFESLIIEIIIGLLIGVPVLVETEVKNDLSS